MTEEPEISFNESIAQSVIKNMDKQIVPMVWNALKVKNYEEVTKIMTRRQEILDQMTARSKEGLEKEVKSKKGVIRRRKSVYR